MSTIAENLIGAAIEDGWTIDRKILKHADETGGFFSVQYIAKRGEKECFLRAIDIQKAIFNSGSTDFASST